MSDPNAPQTAEAPDSLVGEVLAGRYRILSLIGEGAMGAVYLGEHLRIGRRDAIKVLRQDIGRDPESMTRFVRGARNVSLIRHPNVCTIYDFSDTAEGRQFLAMEFIEGETLKDVLDREGRLELERALRITDQVAAALHAAHEVGVVHRDLKPGNIMISRRPDGTEVVKVVDFDIAKGPGEAEGEEVTRLGFVIGTPEYMSPEQLTGERLDGRSDLYSLAVVLYRMLTAALPFRATGTQDMMIERLTGEPIRLSDALPGALPVAISEVVARALSRRREDRQAGTAEFARELRAAMLSPAAPTRTSADAPSVPPRASDVPATVVAPLPVAPAAGTSRPRSAAFAGMAVVALVAVVGIGAVALLRPSGGAPAVEASGAPQGQDLPPANNEASRDETQPAPNGTGTDDGGIPRPRPALPAPEPRASDDAAPPPATPPAPSAPVLAAPLDVVLSRQMAALTANPGGAALRAITDTATMAWAQAATRSDSAAAALTLAQAAMVGGHDEECLQWARRASQLGSGGAAVLLQVCR